MNISLVTLTATAPLAGVPKLKQKSHLPAYRRAYVARMNARHAEHGPHDCKAAGSLLERLAIRSQGEVAAILGVSKQAVHQVEKRAPFKVRRALLGFYGELSH